MNAPHYPDDFFHFGKGAIISDYKINEWLMECYETVINDPNCNSASRSSGDTKVAVSRISEEGFEDYFVSNVYKDYWEKTVGM